MQRFQASRLGDMAALISGLLLTLAFAPFGLFPLAVLAPALLLALCYTETNKRAFWRAYLFGLSFFGSGVYWVYISIHTYGSASYLVSCGITVGFVFLLALFPAMAFYFLNRAFPQWNTSKILCAFPAMWVTFEWIRSWIFTGFPWLLVGYSQTNSPLKGYAPILGVYSVSYAVILTSALCVFAVLHKHNPVFLRRSLIAISSIWLIGAGFCFIPWTHADDTPVKVSLVQGNIAQDMKWSPDQIQPTLDTYLDLTKPHLDSQIIVWPEGAIPISAQTAAEFLDKIGDVVKQHHGSLITGIPVRSYDPDGYYNALITRGDGSGDYYKRVLVPFGEYIPMQAMLRNFLARYITIPMTDFLSGPRKPTLLHAGNTLISATICFEIAFPELALTKNKDVGLLLTVSDDAWFDHSIAQAQHLQTARMRAIEMRRPLLFVSNNGITAIVTPEGKIQASIPAYTADVLTAEVQPRTGLTPWQRLPMEPLLFLLGFLLYFTFRNQKKTVS